MRTTLTLDDDIAERLRALAHAKRISFREIVNDAIRRGLGEVEEVPPYRVRTFRSAFRSGVDTQRLNQLVDELEVDLACGRKT